MTTRLSFPTRKPLVLSRGVSRPRRGSTHGCLRIHLPRIRNRVKVHATDQEKQREQEEVLIKVMKERVEDAAGLLDGIIDDVVCELSAVQAMGFIYQEVPESTEKQIIKKVVKSFLARLDQNFLASLEKFEQKARDMGNNDVAILISKINKEVMQQVQEHFPPEVLLLEDLMKMPDKKDRINKIKEVYEKEVNSKHKCTCHSEEVREVTPKLDLSDLEDIPIEELDLKQELERLKVLKTESGLKQLKEELSKQQSTSDFDDVLNSMDDNPLDDCLEDAEVDDGDEDSIKEDYGKRIDPMQLFMAASQFINDMEEKEEVANRQLLAKLCVIREEARLVELEMRYQGVNLPEDPTKMRENVPAQVMGVIQACVKSSDTMNRVGLIRKAFENDVYGPSEKDVDRAPGFVRPGMFMTALTMVQMEADLNSKMPSTKSQYTPEFLQRLDDIRLEAMLVLKDMGWGEFRSEELSQRQKEKESKSKSSK